MTSLIIGLGEIGNALKAIFEEADPFNFYDNWAGISPGNGFGDLERQFDIIHICFPYSEKFIDHVEEYQERYKPKYTIIHSTVPVGTCRKLGAIHSPVIGIHPNLVPGIKTFPKYLGGEQASEVADYFRRAGLKVYIFDQSETTELMKILDTTFYGVCIEYTKDVKKQCEKFNVPFEAWTLWTQNYNKGYFKLGHPEFSRPNLVPIQTPIQGHCVRPNLELIETKFTKFLKENHD